MRRFAALALLVAATAFAGDFEDGVAAAQKGDYAAARAKWQPLAERGHRDAQFNMGLIHENGLGVPRDGARAAQWFRRAAEQKDRVAQAYLGEMYARGLGVKRDDAEALGWFRQAAELGHAESQYNVGLFYATGRGTEPSDVQAYAWMTVALENGAPRSDLPGRLAQHMSPASLDEAKRLVEEVRRRCRLD